MLHYTGHPLVDVGIATLTAFSRKDDPEALDAADLEAASRYLWQLYTCPGPMQNLIRGTVFFNAGYYQARSDLREQFAQRVLASWYVDASCIPGVRCSFCERTAAYLANREEVPLLNGRHVFNFGGRARAGLPICGMCSLALHMLPLGCVKTGRGLLAAHSEEPILTLGIARRALQQMMQSLSLADVERLPGFPYERTRFVELLVSWMAVMDRRAPDASLTGYYFTNYGASPMIQIYRLDASVVSWLDEMQHHADASLSDAWWRVVNSGWTQKKEDVGTEFLSNAVYEAVLTLPAEGRSFFRRFLKYSYHRGLVELFLERILDMSPERIVLLRTLGDRFASYARSKRGFLYEFSRLNDYSRWRRVILRAADDMARAGRKLITFDEFIDAFTAPPGEINDWRLARDLIALRMIEESGLDDEPLFIADDENETEGEEL